MPELRPLSSRISRRSLLAALPAATALLASTAIPGFALAQEIQAATPFDFDLLTAEMRVLATQPPVVPEHPASFLDTLTYDDYKLIQFLPRRARWQGSDSLFRLHAFHMGWLFADPVRLYEVAAGTARELAFSTDDFEYLGDLPSRVPAHTALPGVAGFRLNAALNRPDLFDEVAAFVGASYFRALGRDNAYGLSARGLAINTAMAQGEEFPRFSRFYLERPAPWAAEVVVCAALESASATGAYRFVIRPGVETVIEVTARLFFRATAEQVGIAPLTSMFLFSEKNRGNFDDYRPNVHDSDGLRILRHDGDVLWRPLNNPPRLSGSYFVEENPQSFGLYQRDRDFANYQDASAQYERRPSVNVEPLGDWGKGSVRLVEIPTDLEVNDNIVAFWVPEAPLLPDTMHEFSYRLRWGALAPDPAADLAHVLETRAGHGGVSGVANTAGTRKFVIDFAGGQLSRLPEGAEVKAVTTVSQGQIVTSTLSRLPGRDIWRLVLDVAGADGATVELGAHVSGFGRKLTETWLYQWIVS